MARKKKKSPDEHDNAIEIVHGDDMNEIKERYLALSPEDQRAFRESLSPQEKKALNRALNR